MSAKAFAYWVWMVNLGGFSGRYLTDPNHNVLWLVGIFVSAVIVLESALSLANERETPETERY